MIRIGIDIGGTTTDVGSLHKGFPRQATVAVEIREISTNFRIPDVFSIGLGGGSLVVEQTPGGEVTVGPRSFRAARGRGPHSLRATMVNASGARAGRAELFRLQRRLPPVQSFALTN